MVANKRSFDPVVQAWVVKVLPGEWAVAQGTDMLQATVASCAVLTVWDRAHGRAVMAHFMVEPQVTGGWTKTALPSPHVEGLLEEMWEGLQAPAGGERVPEYFACVAGGGTVLLQGRLTLGNSNVMKAVDWLHKRKIAIMHYDVGEPIFRRVYFAPGEGISNVRRMAVSRSDTVRMREERYYALLQQQTQGQVA